MSWINLFRVYMENDYSLAEIQNLPEFSCLRDMQAEGKSPSPMCRPMSKSVINHFV
jgi:hypothetical protein